MLTAPPPRRLLGGPTLAGLGLVAALALVYPLLTGRAGDPLSVFLLPPLFVALAADEIETAAVAVVSATVAAVEGLATGMVGVNFAVRLTIIVLGGAAAIVGARVRNAREQDLRSAAVSHALTTAFQEGLVPVPVPPPGLRAVARYRPAAPPLMLGGDFLDVITLPDGAAAFIVGDVVGHGPRAAAFGTRIRAGWKSLAHAMPTEPELWLQEVEDAFFQDHRFDGFVTALTGRFGEDGTVSFVCAGHPWPILAGDDPSFVTLGVGTPLGIRIDRTRPVTTTRVAPSQQLLLYTDGIIENSRTPGGRAGEAKLLDAVRAMGNAVDLDRLLEDFGPRGFDDDVALLLLQPATG